LDVSASPSAHLPGKKTALERWLRQLAYPLLFLVAFLPRAITPGSYVTVDEQRWIERSIDFVYHLTHGNPGAIASVHPGVTATWGFGSFLLARSLVRGDLPALYQARLDNHLDLLALLPVAALFTALATAAAVVASYWLLNSLLGRRTALLAAFLLALDPYLLANSRRVHIDALLASTMFLSALSLLVFISQDPVASKRKAGVSIQRPVPPAWGYLVLSGVMAGLAWLTKLPALYLIPFTLVALGVRCAILSGGLRVDRSALWHVTKAFFLWGGIAGLVFVLLWPSMWTQPGEVLATLVRVARWGVEEPHTTDLVAGAPMQFFLGKLVADPGPAYYPLTLLFRLSPVTFVFLPLGLLVLSVGRWRRRLPYSQALVGGLGVAYVLFFLGMLSLGAKKLEGYALPVYPMVSVVAALGLSAILRGLARPWAARWHWAGLVFHGLAALVIVAGSFLWLRLHPYYSTYFNPLLGGARQASRLYAFGGGEGLDLAARYLNQKPGAGQLVVASAYPDHVFRYQFQGSSVPLRQGDWAGAWLLADYAVSYLSYWQRELPSPQVVGFWETLEPEYVARINGIDYVRVYQVPPLLTDGWPEISRPADVALGEVVAFLGYDLATEEVVPGGEIEMTLYWQRRQPLQTDYSVYLRLVNGAYQVWGSQDGGPLWGAMPTSLWQEQMVVADLRRLPVLPGTPPGVYEIAMGMYDAGTLRRLAPDGETAVLPNATGGVALGEGELFLGPVRVVRSSAAPVPVPAHPHEANLGNQVRLLGFDLAGQPRPGQGLQLILFWQALAPMDQDYMVFVHLVGKQGKIWTQRDSQPVSGFYPTYQWEPGEFVRDPYDLAIPEEIPAGEYTLIVGIYQPETGQRLTVLGGDGQVLGDSVRLQTLLVTAP
jgi:4-amino-4-deoxy-L-arabinose transferase-like glycosyltransferase